MSLAAEALRERLSQMPVFRRIGSVTHVGDAGIESAGPAVALGEVCELMTPGGKPVQAEVVSLHEGRTLLMPYGPCKGITLGTEVVALGERPTVSVGEALLGEVVDAFGRPLAGSLRAGPLARVPLHPDPLNPLRRRPIDTVLATGIRVLDSLLPVGRGQRIGIFSASGVGKSSLLGMLARNVEADVTVIALIGERGREVKDFLSPARRGNSTGRRVVVVATAEQPAVVRVRAAYAATAIAEYFRSRGKHVLLLMDSVTRFAMARREIDLAAGQPPTTRGYTPSVFTEIPALCERCGSVEGEGSITAMYTVLVEGDDQNEPVSDALRSSLDGHVVLSRELANEGHFPAVDVLQSVSRLDTQLLSAVDLALAQHMRALISVHRRQREMVDMGLYKPGANAVLDEALTCWDAITAFLRQGLDEVSSPQASRRLLEAALGRRGQS